MRSMKPRPESTPGADPSGRPAPSPSEAPAAPPPPPEYRMAGPTCRHLRTNSTYVYTDESSSSRSDDTNAICWCLRTHKSFGPDDDLVEKQYCSDPSRSCYEAL